MTAMSTPTPEELELQNRQILRHQFASMGKVAGDSFALSVSAGATNMATVEVSLFKGGICFTERGLLRSQSNHARISTRIGDGGDRAYRLTEGAFKRFLMKEGFLTSQFNNDSADITKIEITPSKYTGLFALNLGDKKDGSIKTPGEKVKWEDTYQSIYCPRGSWLASGPDNETDFVFFSNMLKWANLRGCLPMMMEKITGNDVVILASPKPLKHIDILAGDHQIVDHREVFGFTEMKHGIDYSARRKISGENFESLRFDGPGKLILQHR
jgi:uncharacterized protein (AIM24 family)